MQPQGAHEIGTVLCTVLCQSQRCWLCPLLFTWCEFYVRYCTAKILAGTYLVCELSWSISLLLARRLLLGTHLLSTGDSVVYKGGS